MKIIIFSRFFNNPLKGGAEVSTFQVFSRLSKKHEIHVVTSRVKGEKKYELMDGIHVHRVTVPDSIPYILKSAKFASRLHKKISFDKVFVLMANEAAFAAKLFLMKHKLPSLLNLQSGDSDVYIKKMVPWYAWPFYVRIYRWFDKILAISTFLKKRARTFGAKQEIAVIPNGVDLSLFKPKKLVRKPKTIITTSRLAYKNNVDNLIRALDYLPGYKLIVVGAGEDEKKLKKLAKGKQVEFLGHVPYAKLPSLLCSAHVFARVPYSEGFGNSFIEAMATGTPVVASKEGGIPDFIKDGVSGLYANPSDPQDIAKKILVLENKKLYNAIAKESVAVAKNHDWKIIAKMVEKHL